MPIFFLLACLSKPILSSPHWNRGAGIRIEESQAMPDYSQKGPHSFSRQTGKKKVHPTCTLPYQLYQTEKKDSVLVILSHGFARNAGHMRKWAEHFASWGFSVLTPTHCHVQPRDVNPELAAGELHILSQSLPHTQVIYAGQSNGGALFGCSTVR